MKLTEKENKILNEIFDFTLSDTNNVKREEITVEK